jgi:hypothetical protein
VAVSFIAGGNDYPSVAPNKSSSTFYMLVPVAQSLVFCVVFCRSLFVFSGVSIAQYKTLHRKQKIEQY